MNPTELLRLFALAVRRIREWMESNEEENSRAAQEAHQERAAAIVRHARRQADHASRRAESRARGLLLDDLSRMQRRARKTITSIDGVLAEAAKLQGERLQDWITERKAKRLPADDIEALRLEFRRMEALLCREAYRRNRLYELISHCSELKHELARRSPYFKDAARFGSWMPDEEVYREVPADLPKRFDLVEAEARPVATGLYFSLPAGIKGYLDQTEPATRAPVRGSRRLLHVRSVDYRRATASVSLAAARVIHAFEKAPDTTFKATVASVDAPGAWLVVGGRVRAFLPRSKWIGEMTQGQKLDVRLVKVDRFLDSPVALPCPGTRRRPAEAYP